MSESSVSWRFEDFGTNITLTLFNTSRCITDAIQGVAPSKCVDVSVTADWLAQRASLSFWPWLLSLPWSVEDAQAALETATSAIPAPPLAMVASASASASVDEQPHTVEEESTALENLTGLFLLLALFFVFFGLIAAAADPWGYYYDERPRGRARDGSRYVLVEVKDKLEPPPAKA